MNEQTRKNLALMQAPKKKRKSKYGNKKMTVDGVTYDSKGEYMRECQLKIQARAGIIKDLKRPVEFSLDVNGVHICKYIADWSYTIVECDVPVVEDFKGVLTDVFKLKSKMMKACHGINVWANKEINAHCGSQYPR